jgi:VanZ family protein
MENLGMETKKEIAWKIVILRALLTILCAFVYFWIFSNSLKTAEKSTSQSQAVTDAVQSVVGSIAPQSPIANATGEDYKKLHNDIRMLAHFSEFLLLGFLVTCCYCSYVLTNEKRKKWVFIPLLAIAITPPIDELLQTLSEGRAMEFLDVIVDMVGGFLGFGLAIVCLWIGFTLYYKRRKKVVEANE